MAEEKVTKPKLAAVPVEDPEYRKGRYKPRNAFPSERDFTKVRFYVYLTREIDDVELREKSNYTREEVMDLLREFRDAHTG